MAEFFSTQMDYVYFVYGLAFLLLAATCVSPAGRRCQTTPWRWLALFGLLHGLNEWLDLVAISTGDSAVFLWTRAAILGLSFLALAEFGRSGLARQGVRWMPGPWPLAVLASAACAMIALGPDVFAAVVRYDLGFLGTVLAAAALGRASRQTGGSRWLGLMAAAMLLYGLATGLVVTPCGFWPASVINTDTFLATVGLPVQLVRAVLAGTMTLSLHFHFRLCAEEPAEGRTAPCCSAIAPAVAVLVVLAAGWMGTEKAGRDEDAEHRNNILGLARMAAASVDPDTLAQLTASPDDVAKPAYQRLRNQLLVAGRIHPYCRRIYGMRMVGGQIRSTFDSEPAPGPAQPDTLHVEPGAAYPESPAALLEVFRTGQAAIAGPYTDQWGTWISAFAQVPGTADVIAVDADAEVVRASVDLARGSTLAITALVVLMIVGFWIALRRLRYDAMLLARSQRNFTKAFETSSVAKTILSPRTQRFLAVNHAFEAVTGYRREEIVGRTGQEINIYSDPADGRRIFESLAHGGALHGKENQYRMKSGEIRIGRLSAEIIEYDGEPAILSVVDDVTDLKRAEQELRLRNALLSTEQEVSNDGILAVDEHGDMISCNRRFVDLWRTPEEIVLSKRDEDSLRDSVEKVVDPKAFLDRINYLYEHRNESSRDEVLLKDGRVFDRYSAPMFGPDGEYYGRVWFFHDITDLRRSQQEAQRASEALAASVRQLEERQRQAAILGEMHELLQACSSMADLAPAIRGGMERLLPGARGALYLVSPSRADLECVCRWGGLAKGDDPEAFAPDACWALRLGHVHMIEDPGRDPVCPHIRHALEGGAICLPLTAKGDVLGLMHLECASAAGQAVCTADLKDAAIAVSQILSISVANIRLRETLSYQSIRDPLTGLYNRRYMEEVLSRETARSVRHHTQTGIVMCDIDHFKTFNDSFGHAAGDAVLVELARFLKRSLRAEDIVCRYGGEEFVLILPDGASLEDVRDRADQLRSAIRDLRIPFHGQTLAITLSMGVACCPGHSSDAGELLRTADEALYRAKQEGRDRVVVGACPVPAA
jgi:diguanylate cyclase (GGDEF)-like protein/PAS domain S-box-containing protein